MDKNIETVSYLVYESSQTRQDRIIHRLIIALLVAVAFIFLSNAVWLWAWTHYDNRADEISYSQEGEGINIIGDNNTGNSNG